MDHHLFLLRIDHHLYLHQHHLHQKNRHHHLDSVLNTYQSRESRVHKKDKEQDTVDHRQEGKKLAEYRQHLKMVAMKMMRIVRIILIRAVLMMTMLVKNVRK